MPKFLDKFPKPLLKDIVENRCVPIIGAGFSRNAKLPPGKEMPLWADLGKYFAQQLGDPTYTSPIDAISAFCHEFSRVACVEHLRRLLHVDEVVPGDAHFAFADLPFDTVITTNFEFLLEQAYLQRGRRVYPIIEENQLPVSTGSEAVRLLKIHGDLDHPGNLILTEDDHDRFLERYPLLSTHIASLLISRTPLFVGYSLDDPDFRTIFQVVKARLGRLRRPAYTIGVGLSPAAKIRFERRDVRVINLE